MSTSPAPYFFMSYSREDTAKQRRVIKELRERGVNIWVDIENLTPGTPTWEREIEKAIRGATGIIVLLSPESNNSEWVRREISFGEQHRKRIFPVLIEGDDHTSTPLRLANHQRVDLRTKFESGLDELANAIKDYIGVKQEIAAQIQSEVKERRSPSHPIDLKKFGMPALFILIGLLLAGGIMAIINKPPAETPTPTDIIVTSQPDVDPVITETKAPEETNDELTGRIVYSCEIEGSEICVMNVDGSNWRRLTDNKYANFSPSPSPDGKTALFVTNYGDYSEIHEVNLNTGTIHQLTDLKMSLGAPTISPDNKYILFHVRAKNNNLQLWLMNRDGSNPQEFYGVSGKDVHDPTWSPDGTQILFALGKGDNNKLYIMEFNERDPQLVNDTIDSRGRSDWSIKDQIAFDQGGPWAHNVFTMNLDGSRLTQLTNGTNAQGVSFSPDGKWITFTAYTNVAGKDQASCEIYIMRVDGSDMQRLTNNNYCDYQPRWSK